MFRKISKKSPPPSINPGDTTPAAVTISAHRVTSLHLLSPTAPTARPRAKMYSNKQSNPPCCDFSPNHAPPLAATISPNNASSRISAVHSSKPNNSLFMAPAALMALSPAPSAAPPSSSAPSAPRQTNSSDATLIRTAEEPPSSSGNGLVGWEGVVLTTQVLSSSDRHCTTPCTEVVEQFSLVWGFSFFVFGLPRLRQNSADIKFSRAERTSGSGVVRWSQAGRSGSGVVVAGTSTLRPIKYSCSCRTGKPVLSDR